MKKRILIFVSTIAITLMAIFFLKHPINFQQRKVETAFAISENCQVYVTGQLPIPIPEDVGISCKFF